MRYTPSISVGIALRIVLVIVSRASFVMGGRGDEYAMRVGISSQFAWVKTSHAPANSLALPALFLEMALPSANV